MALSSGQQGTTINRALNKLQYAVTNIADDIATATTSDVVVMLDASDSYKPKYADSDNVIELIGAAATGAEITRVADVSARVVTLVASGAISLASHENKTLLLGEVGGNALCAMTLPAATGSGAIYRFIVSVANTSSYTITTDGTDVYNGCILAHDRDITDGTLLHAFAATTQTIITLNGGTTGGQIGDWIIIEDILAGKWHVRGQVAVPAGSNPATMFS